MRNTMKSRDRSASLEMLTAAVDAAMEQLGDDTVRTPRATRAVLDETGVTRTLKALHRRGGIASHRTSSGLCAA